MYNPNPFGEHPYVAKIQSRCIFYAVSRCNDIVNPNLCNKHAEMFNLTYQNIMEVDGNNREFWRRRIFVCGNSDLQIPAFVDKNGATVASVIRSFVVKTKANYSEVNAEALADALSRLSGNTLFSYDDCVKNRMMDKTQTQLHLYSGNNMEVFPHVTHLMMVLFESATPSQIHDPETDTWEEHIANVGLFETRDALDNCLEFRLMNKAMMRKYRPNKAILAAPVVLSSSYIRSQGATKHVIRIDKDPMSFGC